MKSTLRTLYRLFPFKRPLCLLLRRVWTPPGSISGHLTFRGPFSVTIDGRHQFRLVHYGFPVENSLFWGGLAGCWEKVSVGLWVRLCRRASVIADVGANTGVYALIAATLRPEGQVYAFEPLRRTFDRLEANARMNGLPIHCINAALSDLTGTATIYDPGDEMAYSISVNKDAYGGAPASPVEIQTYRFDDFADAQGLPHIDLIKIDVETHEPAVVRGLGRYLREYRPTLLIEIRDEDVARDVEDQVAGLGYLYFNIDENAGVRRVEHLGASDYFNFLICTEDTARAIGLV